MTQTNENHEELQIQKTEIVVTSGDMVLSEEQKTELKRFVSTEVYATATAGLQAEVDEELKIPDVLQSVAFVGDLVEGS